jgi:hypothetical protein
VVSYLFLLLGIFFSIEYCLVADYDPMNDDRGSLARGYEPTSKAIHAASKFINKYS